MRLGFGVGVVDVGTQGGVADAADESAPAWVLLADGNLPALDLDLDNNRAYVGGVVTTPSAILTSSRTGANATYINKAGLLTTIAANTLRIGDAGLLSEPAATNVVLWNRDLTNAAWTKTNCTAAKDQTGIDGVSNSASSLTATAGNATCLQAITVASASRVQSAFVKRLTGSGTVEMTTDNGTTWTAVQVTSAWSRVDIPPQTLANPTVGFRIVTSGDAIAIDYVQNEASVLTSPIATTTVAQTRNLDNISITTPSFLAGLTGLTTLGIGSSNTTFASSVQAISALDNAGNAGFFARQSGSAVTAFVRDQASVVQMNVNITSINAHRYRKKHVLTMSTNSAALVLEDGNSLTDTSCTLPPLTRFFIGGQGTVGQWGGLVHRVTAWPVGVSLLEAQAVSAADNDLTIIGEGDSITAGTTSWLNQLRTIMPLRWHAHSVAVPGSSLNSGTALWNINSTTRKNALHALRTRYVTANPAKPVLTFIFTGHNEVALDGNNAATIISELQTYCTELRAAGHTLVVVPMTPSTTANVNTVRATVNAAIATWVGTYADYVVDWAGVSGMADGDASNTALWPDGIHPSAAQSLVMAQAIKTQVLDVVTA